MTHTDTEIRGIINEFVRSAQYSDIQYGFIGEPIGNGAYRTRGAKAGYVRVRLVQNDIITSIIDAINFKAPIDPRIRVLVGKNKSGEYEVIDVDAQYIASQLGAILGAGVGPHTHRLGFGLEDYVEPRRLEMGLVRIYDQTLTVQVLPYSYVDSNGDHAYFAGATLDLTAYRPISGWCWAKVGINTSTGVLMVETTTPVTSRGLLTTDDLYTLSFDGIPLAGVKLKADMSAIDEEKYFADARLWLGSMSASGGGASTDYITSEGDILQTTSEELITKE
jgi:hypothetical protein